MRKINRVFIHCSASDHSHHDNIETIRKWHVIDNGWSDIGYHYVITKDGTIHNGRPIGRIPAAQAGHNTGSIAICLTGKDYFSEKQFEALRCLCHKLNKEYDVTFHGHREVANKTCPNFEYKSVLKLDLDGNMPVIDLTKIKTKQGFFDTLLSLIQRFMGKI